MLKINQRKDKDITIFDMEGTFDTDAEDHVKDQINNNPKNLHGNFLWNFNEISSISSSGIGILLNTFMEIKKKGGTTKLVSVRPQVLEAFEVHKVLPFFDIYYDEKAAIRRIQLEIKEKGSTYRRLFERINVNLKTKYKRFKKGGIPGIHRFHKGSTKSISMGGIFLQTKSTYPANTLLEVKLLLHNSFFRPHVKLLGKVVWVAEKERQPDLYPGMAFNILSMEEKEKAKLEEFIKQQGE